MAKYCCPHCHKNERISEYVNSVMVYLGQLNDLGEIEDDFPDTDEMYSDHFFCHSCQEVFEEPEKVEE